MMIMCFCRDVTHYKSDLFVFWVVNGTIQDIAFALVLNGFNHYNHNGQIAQEQMFLLVAAQTGTIKSSK